MDKTKFFKIIKSILIIIIFILFGSLSFFNNERAIFFTLAFAAMLVILELFVIIKEKKSLKSFFKISRKKVTAFIIIFLFFNILIPNVIACVSCDQAGFPFEYYHDFNNENARFNFLSFIFNLLFWYVVTSLIIKRPEEIENKIN